LVINGRDYVKNPENHFTLTVLGAVAELERAKIIERTSRGRALRLSQGQLLGCGVHTFGYHYIRKSPTSLPQMVVNGRVPIKHRNGTEIGTRYLSSNDEDPLDRPPRHEASPVIHSHDSS
jgi:hypothetical protein